MISRAFLFGFLLAPVFGVSSAHATTYAFDYSSIYEEIGPISASGLVVTDGIKTVMGIFGTVNGAAITGLSSSPFGLPTNLLIYVGPTYSLTDFSFSGSDGLTYEIGTLYDDILHLPFYAGYAGSSVPNVTFGTLSISTVPLPASLPLYGAALFGLGIVGLVMKRKTYAPVRDKAHAHAGKSAGV